MSNTQPVRMRVSTYAKMKGCSPQNVRNAIKSGHITTERIAGMTVVVLDANTKAWTPNMANVLKGKMGVLHRKKNPVSQRVVEETIAYRRKVAEDVRQLLEEEDESAG